MRYVFDDYILDTRRYELSCRGNILKLRPKVFEVLAHLIRHRDRVVSKDELLEQLWPNQFIADGTLNAYLIVVGSLAHDPHRLYTAIGDTLHLAIGLQRAAPSHGILMGHATYQLVQEEVRGEVWEAHARRATPLPGRIYTVRSVIQRRAGVPRRHAQPRSPFVGRTQELAILHERLAQVERGQGQVVSITGEAGIGKSRLLAEFWRSVHGRRVTCLAGQCLPYGQLTPYLPVLALLRQRCGITDAASHDTIRTSVHRAVQEAHIGSDADARPALLAHHYTEAGLYQQAIEYWRRAGAQAFQRGAYREALAHLGRGLALLESLPESDACRQCELDLHTMLGPICMVTQGGNSP